MNYDILCKEILSIDPNVRFAVAFREGERLGGGYRDNVSSLLSPDEVNTSLSYACQRWETRKNLAHRIGKAKFSITEYEKVRQITLPVDEKTLLLVSLETNVEYFRVVEILLNLKKIIQQIESDVTK